MPLFVDNLVTIGARTTVLADLITPANFPQYTPARLERVRSLLQASIDEYIERNTVRGCTQRGAENFNYQANLDDGSCAPPTHNYTWGGVYQTCKGQDRTPNWRCAGFYQPNAFTGGSSFSESMCSL